MEFFSAQQLQATPGKLQASDACISPLTGFRDDLSERDGQRSLARRKAKQSNFGTSRIAVIRLANLLAPKLPFRQATEWRQSDPDFVNHYFGHWPVAGIGDRILKLSFHKANIPLRSLDAKSLPDATALVGRNDAAFRAACRLASLVIFETGLSFTAAGRGVPLKELPCGAP